jgi:hypothetical protein
VLRLGHRSLLTTESKQCLGIYECDIGRLTEEYKTKWEMSTELDTCGTFKQPQETMKYR